MGFKEHQMVIAWDRESMGNIMMVIYWDVDGISWDVTNNTS